MSIMSVRTVVTVVFAIGLCFQACDADIQLRPFKKLSDKISLEGITSSSTMGQLKQAVGLRTSGELTLSSMHYYVKEGRLDGSNDDATLKDLGVEDDDAGLLLWSTQWRHAPSFNIDPGCGEDDTTVCISNAPKFWRLFMKLKTKAVFMQVENTNAETGETTEDLLAVELDGSDSCASVHSARASKKTREIVVVGSKIKQIVRVDFKDASTTSFCRRNT